MDSAAIRSLLSQLTDVAAVIMLLTILNFMLKRISLSRQFQWHNSEGRNVVCLGDVCCDSTCLLQNENIGVEIKVDHSGTRLVNSSTFLHVNICMFQYGVCLTARHLHHMFVHINRLVAAEFVTFYGNTRKKDQCLTSSVA